MTPVIFSQNRQTSIVYVCIAMLGCALLVVLSAVMTQARRQQETAVYFLDVGQGDSSLIQLASGARVLIDGGPDGAKLLAQLDVLLPPADRSIDLLVMTHPQLDHFGGLIEVLRQYRVGAFIGTLRAGSSAAYQALHDEIERHGVPYVQLIDGDVLRINDAVLYALSPTPRQVIDEELNESSLVLYAQLPEYSVLFTGDMSAATEESLVDRYAVRADILKVSHHGSRFSSSERFLKAIQPRLAVIEVGKNSYGHPTKQALTRLEASGAAVFRTDQQGTIKVTAHDERLDIFSIIR